MTPDPDGTPTGELEALRAGISRTGLANWLAVGGLVTLLGSLVAAWVSKAISPDHAVYTALRNGLGPWLAFGIAPLLVLSGMALRRKVPRGPAQVRVEQTEIVIDRGRGRVSRVHIADLTEGMVVRRHGSAELELHRRNGDIVRIEVALEHEAALEQLLADAGIGPEKRRLRTRVGGWQSAVPRAFVGTVALIFTVIPALRAWWPGLGQGLGPPGETVLRMGILAAIAAAAWFLANASLGPEIVVGTDGITVRSLGRARFVAHEQITNVASQGDGAVRVTLTDGTSLSLGKTRDRAHADGLAERILRAKSVRSASPEATARAEALDRRGRPLAEWRAVLGALLDARPGGYRTATLERADLIRVVADPDGPADRRIGAALALRVTADPEASAHVRAAARACADDRVRVALEKIAAGEDDDDVLEAASARAER